MRIPMSLSDSKSETGDLIVTAEADVTVGQVLGALRLEREPALRTQSGRILSDGDVLGDCVSAGSILTLTKRPPGPFMRAALDQPVVMPKCETDMTRGTRLATRPPRSLPALEDAPIDPPIAPPPPMSVARLSVAMMLVPLIIGGLLIFVFGPLMAIFALLSPLMIGGSYVEDRFRKKRWRKRAAAEIATAMPGFLEQLHIQRGLRYMREQYLSPPNTELLGRHLGPATDRLWERRPKDPDFASVTVGYAAGVDTPVLADLARPNDELFDDVANAVADFQEDASFPMRLELKPGRVVGIYGVASTRWRLVRRILAELASTHGPADARIAVLTRKESLHEVAAAKWLPHVRFDLTSGDLLIGTDAQSDEIVLRALLDDRSSVRKFLVVDAECFSGKTETLIRELAAAGDAAAAVVIVGKQRTDLVEICEPLVNTYDDQVAVESARTGAAPVAAEVIHLAPGDFEACCRGLAGWRDPLVPDRAADLPVSVSLASLFGGRIDARSVKQLWDLNACRSPQAIIGMAESGPLSLSLVDDGPHGLAGGTTGSGKSELLRTLVLSLALQASPADLNFVLIDYKGGAAFDLCADLPHVAGLVTDLDDHLAERALKSLKAELARRERFLRRHEVESIDEYWRVGDSERLARLFVIVDEFSLLANELPDFVDSLVEISQTGRSLGVHMLLATQRPAGVVKDNIRANTNFRIALRTQRSSDSEDILDAKDAALLPRNIPGRALIRFGADGLIPFQAASVSLATLGTVGSPVKVHSFDAQLRPDARLFRESSTQSSSATGEPDARRLSAVINEALQSTEQGRAREIWAPILSASDTSIESLEQLITQQRSGNGWQLGIADNPTEQTQHPWLWNPVKDGNLVCFGTLASGLTNPLITAAAMASTSASAWEVHALDFTGTGLDTVGSLPATGSAIKGGERERITRLLGYLTTQLDERRRTPGFFRILVLIDGYAGFRSEFESPSDYVYQDALGRIIRDGPSQGIHTIVTAHQPSAIPNTISATIAHRLAFNLADKHDYATLGLRVANISSLENGSAIHQPSGLHVQTHTISNALFDQLCNQPSVRPPTMIGTLPSVVKVDEVSGEVELGEVSWRIPVGIADDSLRSAYLDLGPHEHAVVSGPAKSGRSTMLVTIGQLLSAHPRPPVLLGLAPGRSPLHQETNIGCFTEPETLVAEIEAMTDIDRIAVLVDDATRADPDNVLGGLFLSSDHEIHVFASERSDLLRNAFNHWVRDLRQQGTGVVCRAQPETDNDLFGVRIPKHDHPPTERLAALVTQGLATIIRPVSS